MAKSDRRKPWPELFFDGRPGIPLAKEHAGPLAEALEAVRIGPSASNKQPWRVVREGSNYHFFLQRTPGYDKLTGEIRLQEVDMGIALCHFGAAAREIGSPEWKEQDHLRFSTWEYVLSDEKRMRHGTTCRRPKDPSLSPCGLLPPAFARRRGRGGRGRPSALVVKPDHIIVLRHARSGTGIRPISGSGTAHPANSPEAGDRRTGSGRGSRPAGLARPRSTAASGRCSRRRALWRGARRRAARAEFLFPSPGEEERYTRALRAWIAGADLRRPVVLVTHQVNITALTGIFPAEGEVLILHRRAAKLGVVARFRDGGPATGP
jgi:hypothetical protein